MYVNIEFLDTEPMENVITALHYKMDKTIFIGFHDTITAYKKQTISFLRGNCEVKEVEFVEVPSNDLCAIEAAIRKQVVNEQNAGNKVFFDITGGEGLILVAFGMLSKEYTLPMHQFDVIGDKIKELNVNEATPLSQYRDVQRNEKVAMNLDKYVSMWGGEIKRSPEDNKDKLPIHSEDFLKKIPAIWNVLQAYKEEWNKFTSCMSGTLKTIDLEVDTIVEVDAIYKWDDFQKFLKKLSDAEAISKPFIDAVKKEKKSDPERVRIKFRYDSWDIKRVFLKSGNVFELKVYLDRKNEVGTLDCDMGVKIDWDGNAANGGVFNEIDVMSLKGNIVTFVSCKGGDMEGNAALNPMYQMDTIASRFGGKYARKMLATRERISDVHLERAESMNIEWKWYR